MIKNRSITKGTPQQFAEVLKRKIVDITNEDDFIGASTEVDDEFDTDCRYYVYDDRDNCISDPYLNVDDAIEFAEENDYPIVKVHNYYIDNDKHYPDGDPEIVWEDGVNLIEAATNTANIGVAPAVIDDEDIISSQSSNSSTYDEVADSIADEFMNDGHGFPVTQVRSNMLNIKVYSDPGKQHCIYNKMIDLSEYDDQIAEFGADYLSARLYEQALLEIDEGSTSDDVNAASSIVDMGDPTAAERYIHNLIGDLESAYDENIVGAAYDQTDVELIVTVTTSDTQVLEFTIPFEDLTFDFDRIDEDVEYIVDAIHNELSGSGEDTEIESATTLDDYIDDDDEIYSDYEFVESKSVEDSDGFMTDYTWYRCADGRHVFVFGDNDVYIPEDGYFDHECDSEEEAREWFESYKGFADDEDFDYDFDDDESGDDVLRHHMGRG